MMILAPKIRCQAPNTFFAKDHLDALESKRLRAVGSESQQPKLGIK